MTTASILRHGHKARQSLRKAAAKRIPKRVKLGDYSPYDAGNPKPTARELAKMSPSERFVHFINCWDGG